MSVLTDDLTYIRDQVCHARRQLGRAKPCPSVREALVRLEETLPALEAVLDGLEDLQRRALHAGGGRRRT